MGRQQNTKWAKYALHFLVQFGPNKRYMCLLGFECVEKVVLKSIDLGMNLLSFVNLFPHLNELKMVDVSVDKNGTNARFPHLENFHILDVNIDNQEFKMETLKVILNANPQLRKLKLILLDDGEEITEEEVLNAIKGNPLITTLDIYTAITTKIDHNDLMQYVSEHPNTIELTLINFQTTPQVLINFIRELKSLKVFRFAFDDEADYNQLVSQLDNDWKHEYVTILGRHIVKFER